MKDFINRHRITLICSRESISKADDDLHSPENDDIERGLKLSTTDQATGGVKIYIHETLQTANNKSSCLSENLFTLSIFSRWLNHESLKVALPVLPTLHNTHAPLHF